MKALVLAALTAGLSFAGGLNGPAPGFILDARTGSLRPVLGMPGAMQLGDAVSLPFHAISADFDPNGNFAVVVSDETPSHVYVIKNLTNPVITDLGTVADNSSVLGVNRTGQTAVLSAPGQFQFLTGLGDSPALANAIPTGSLLGPISAGVVDDAGQCALVGTSADATAALETLCADGSSQRVLTQDGMRITAIALANQGQDAIVADSAGQQVLLIASYASQAGVSVLASSNDGVNAPVGIQVSGQQAIVADSGASAIFVVDLAGQAAVRTIALNGPPARLKLMADKSVALLSDPTSAPFSIFDIQAMQSFFIPTN